jgi:hypothetical protein
MAKTPLAAVEAAWWCLPSIVREKKFGSFTRELFPGGKIPRIPVFPSPELQARARQKLTLSSFPVPLKHKTTNVILSQFQDFTVHKEKMSITRSPQTKSSKKPWTAEEDENLLKLIAQYGKSGGSW